MTQHKYLIWRGDNAAKLAEFFGIVDTEADNTLQVKVPAEPRFKAIEAIESVKPQNSQLRKDIAALYAMNARLAKTVEPDGYTPIKVARAAIKAQAPLIAAIKALQDMDDIVGCDNWTAWHKYSEALSLDAWGFFVDYLVGTIKIQKPCVTRLKLHDDTAIVVETHDTRKYTYLTYYYAKL